MIIYSENGLSGIFREMDTLCKFSIIITGGVDLHDFQFAFLSPKCFHCKRKELASMGVEMGKKNILTGFASLARVSVPLKCTSADRAWLARVWVLSKWGRTLSFSWEQFSSSWSSSLSDWRQILQIWVPCTPLIVFHFHKESSIYP